MNDVEKEKIIKSSDIGYLEDGYQYFFANKDRGALSANALRVIADELDRRNFLWDKQVRKDI